MGNIIGITVKAYDEASAELEGITKGIEKMEPAFKRMAAIGGAAFVGLSAGIYKATQMATDAQEIYNKFDVVFGDVSKSAESVATDLVDNFGLAESKAKDLLSATGDMLTGFGMSGEMALDLAEKSNKLAVDLASFTNIQGGAERASKALTKALLGERESVKELGIAILEEDVKAKIEAMKASGEFTNETERQMKALATYEIAVEQSKNAIGDFARTQDSLANQQRVLKQRTVELVESFGELFIPMMQQVVQFILPMVKSLKDWIQENQKLATVITVAATALAGFVATAGLLGLAAPVIVKGLAMMKVAVIGVGKAFTFLAAHPVVAVFTAVAAVIILLVNRFKTLASELGGFSKAWEFIMLKIKKDFWGVMETIVEGINKVAQYIPGLSSMVGDSLDFINDKAEESQEAFDAFNEEVKRAAEDSENALNSVGDEAGTMANSFGAVETRITEAMTSSKEKIDSLKQSIKALNDDLASIEEQYGKKRIDEVENYNKETAKIVAGYELEIKDLKEKALKEEKAGNKKAAQDLFDQINEKQKELNKFYSWELELEEEIAWEKEKLQMSELELLRANHFEKLAIIEEEKREARAKKEEQVRLLEEQLAEEKKILRERENEYKEHNKRVGDAFVSALNYQIDNLNKFIKFVGENPIGEFLGITGEQIPNITSKKEKKMNAFLGQSPADNFYNQLSGASPSNVTINVNGGNYLDREAGNKFGEYLANQIKKQLRQYQNR